MSGHINRRSCFGAALAVAAAPQARAAETGLALGDRAHFLARPEFREPLVRCFSQVLGCGPPALLSVRGFPEPIVAFRFPGGGALSIEFTPEALDERMARRGCWLEIRCDDPQALQAAVLAAGYPQVRYAATRTFYFAAPGGQVVGILGRTAAEPLPPRVKLVPPAG